MPGVPSKFTFWTLPPHARTRSISPWCDMPSSSMARTVTASSTARRRAVEGIVTHPVGFSVAQLHHRSDLPGWFFYQCQPTQRPSYGQTRSRVRWERWRWRVRNAPVLWSGATSYEPALATRSAAVRNWRLSRRSPDWNAQTHRRTSLVVQASFRPRCHIHNEALDAKRPQIHHHVSVSRPVVPSTFTSSARDLGQPHRSEEFV